MRLLRLQSGLLWLWLCWRSALGVKGPFEQSDAYGAVVSVSVAGEQRCGAVLVSERLAVSIASCFFRLAAVGAEKRLSRRDRALSGDSASQAIASQRREYT